MTVLPRESEKYWRRIQFKPKNRFAKLHTSTHQTPDIAPSLDKITRISQDIIMLTRESSAFRYDKADDIILPPLSEIDDIIRLQLMLSAELSRLYAALSNNNQHSMQCTSHL
ncbi:hypothetical protein BDV27DRAFT_119727 [Aspergillus caelatus]|uniref:Uncharacterized protein n=1 Tax=Aspergillus caelatus TaxID=61420 RepID=A0A5N7AJR6_9EURO|nr:uncharacterized protein BDV27DRAFT_119727 [Aspergillus caelatus]KAE8370142.1 hypothetical protein BDV27DRAFT_119727 [Aspergillus caelatus]